MIENQINTKVKKVLFALVIALLFFPMIQQQWGLVDLKPLRGAFRVSSNPSFDFQNWLEGKYQDEKQKYIKQNVGFASFFIRLKNQVYFSAFNQAKAKSVVVGNNQYLCQEKYIMSFLGKDFVGEEKVHEDVLKLKRVVDTLQAKGIELVFIIAPGKASFYPELIPSSYDLNEKGVTNHEAYSKAIGQNEIHLLDFHSWFNEMKPTSAFPLIPKTGAHWSEYGELLAADSMISYINTIYHKKQIPSLSFGKIESSNEMRYSDDDIEKGMNLLFDIEDLTMGYPEFHIEELESAEKTKMLTVGDSFFTCMFRWIKPKEVFNNGQFWFYNKEAFHKGSSEPIILEGINVLKEVEKNDVVIIMTTDANLPNFTFGFVDQLFDCYYNSKVE